MTERRVADAIRDLAVRRRWDLIALAALVVAAAAFLAPSVVDGGTFGPFDYGTTLTTLGAGLYPHIHNLSNGDALSQMISWNTLDWRMIHSGHFPLWNDYSGLGMPEFLNFESSVLSLPDLVSYLAPLRDAFLVVVFVKFVIAGTGAYAFARVIRLRIPAALFAGVTFMFSGAFANWITWPLADVVAWTGWIAALVVVTYRSRRKLAVAALAVAVAFSVYGGFPEANVMLVWVLGTFFAVAAVASWICGRRPSVPGLLHATAGVLAGVALSAPLWLPGLQVIAGSHRTNEGGYPGLPMKSLPLLFAQGYLGEPFTGPTHYGLKYINYYEATAYLGIPALALALVALLGARRKPLVIGLGVALLAAFVASYDPVGLGFFFRIVNHIGGLREIRFERTKVVGGFVVAALGAVGFDECWSALADHKVLRRQWLGFAVMTLVVGAVTVRTLEERSSHIPARYVPHARALIAPVLLVVLLIGVAALAAFTRRWRPALAGRARQGGLSVLLACQVAFLFISGVGVPSYSHAFYPSTSSENRLESLVGGSLVGLDGGNPTDVSDHGDVGFYPEVNIGYGVRVFAIHDPLLPTAYAAAWPVPAATAKLSQGLFVPDVNSASIAREFGISYILASSAVAAPRGAVRVTTLDAGTIDPEILYRVPGAARFSFSDPAVGSVTSVAGSAATGFTLTTRSTTRATLVLRVTSVAGWHASIDGKPAELARYDDVMESVSVPGGTHTITLGYFPRRLSIGIAVALATVVVAVVIGADWARRRRSFGRARASSVDGPSAP